jgi:uncharacterized protein
MKPMPTNSRDLLDNRIYFFDAGIRFECRQCGQCCTGEPGTIYVTRREIQALADHFALAEDAFARRYLYPFKDSYSIGEFGDGRCFFFDGGCTIYPLRPAQCRTFPFWFSNLRSEQGWRRIAAKCPGIGHGRLYTRHEILQMLQDTLRI